MIPGRKIISSLFDITSASFLENPFERVLSKSAAALIGGLKKKEYPCAFSVSEGIDSSAAIKNKKSACFPSPPASRSLVALVRAWHHSP